MSANQYVRRMEALVEEGKARRVVEDGHVRGYELTDEGRETELMDFFRLLEDGVEEAIGGMAGEFGKIPESGGDPELGARVKGLRSAFERRWRSALGLTDGEGAMKPKIYLWCSVMGHLDGSTGVGVNALAEDGKWLAGYCSGDVELAKHDIGLTSDRQHGRYERHYPDGYELVWLDDPTSDPGWLGAYARHLTPEGHCLLCGDDLRRGETCRCGASWVDAGERGGK